MDDFDNDGWLDMVTPAGMHRSTWLGNEATLKD